MLGFGGNLGDPEATIRRALVRLGERGVAIRRVSGFYRTPPWGPVPQPDFVNACAAGDTRLAPRDLLALAKSLEGELGRVPGERWGPRAIDIDILDYAGQELDEPGLALPHPRLTERAFVLAPLAEIAPDRIVAGRSIRDWAERIDRTGIVRLD
ncbi:2-amino-4-hydroxy-6-hydroxymethyldihydropteridine diphosphokinase [Enterovirga aerilata]|uniref:2-amino-4-hydroxy-6- hydroxymethyldihydropteridine diphosphokinase n=1 Tax=Enterovirga aerilata TaxID=2730920 RepID=UPI001FF044C3|nr:2-amino-4-hydroxy-6-hydroxymethyldihydropteridine diphosphokinase [Enterovirga sp. DB1703]